MTERRRERRLPVNEKARLWLLDGRVRDAAVTDISLDGIGLALDQPLERSEPVTVALQLPVAGRAVALAAAARTAYVVPGHGEASQRYRAGLRFVTLDERTAHTLRTFAHEGTANDTA